MRIAYVSGVAIFDRRRRVELQIESESGGQGLRNILVPRVPEQLPHTIKRANLTRLPIWRSSRLKSRQNHRTIASDSDLTSRLILELQPNIL